jgi:protein-export membrane protein SecD
MWKTRIIAIVFVALGIFLGSYVYKTEMDGTNPFKLGLDLKGGSYLVYKADVSEIAESEVKTSMDALRDVIERRINAFGIAEPNVQTETNSIAGDAEERLVIELPGVTDLDQAVEMIGQTPLLEFKTERIEEERLAILAEIKKVQEALGKKEGDTITNEEVIGLADKDIDFDLISKDPYYVNTQLTGKYLEKSTLQFSNGRIQNGGSLQAEPIIGLKFNKEGADLFEKITTENVDKTIAIYLDGILVSAPRVNQAISGGSAIIEGNFTIEEAKETVGRLNSGALPIPIELISTNTIGPTLGHNAVEAGVMAGIWGLIFVALILVLWYRLPGLIAVLALGIYTAIMLWLFKFIPVTLTSAGIAGFIISIGIAVDANILIFERMKEEIADGRSLYDAIDNGFKRAWASIRDANISSIISAVILFWFGTALIKGFALTFGIGILVSMFSAVTVTRSIIMSFTDKEKKQPSKIMKFLFQTGLLGLTKKTK